MLANARRSRTLEDEQQRIERLRSGDLDALGDLFRDLGGVMSAVARTMLRDRDEADDVVEEALVRIHAAARDFRGTRGLRTWTLRIVANLCRDRLRRRKFDAGRAEDLDRLGHAGLSVSPVAEWDEAIDRSRVLEALERAIDRLPREQREAVVLCHRAGLSQAEAAEVLGIAEGSVKARLHRARHKLRAALEPLMEGVPK